MCDARYRETLLQRVDARIDLKFARWESERTERRFRVYMAALWIFAVATWIFAIAVLS